MGTVTPIGGHPSGCRPGERCDWSFHDDDTGRDIDVINGILLGFATSQRSEHNHPIYDPLARAKARHPAARSNPPCSACRWFEIHIIKHDDDFIVSYVGRTTLDGETDRQNCHVTRSAHAVIEVLTQSRNGEMFIPRTSRLALSEAAGHDPDIEAAWIDRAV